jgi:glycosyltransferase involved in cell wall biosynthesis
MSAAAPARPTVSVVVPVYNGARSLPELTNRLRLVASDCNIIEVILVDDASTDASWSVVCDLARRSALVRGVALARNVGQHAALLAGISLTRGDFIVTMDDDLQHRPEEIHTLLLACGDDTDVVYGTAVEEEHSPFRNVTSRTAKGTIALLAGSPVLRDASGFRCIRGSLREHLYPQRGPDVSLDVILEWATQRVKSVPVSMDQRRYGESNYSFRKLTRHAMTMLVGLSAAPLHVVSWVGLALGTFGLALMMFVVARFLGGGTGVPGFAFLASVLALFSGMQMLALGVIGRYLLRVFSTSVGRPTYTIRATVGESPDHR